MPFSTQYPNGKPCSCGCGFLCKPYFKYGRLKGYSRIAPDCPNKPIRARHPNKSHKGKAHPRYKPIGTRTLHHAARGVYYWRIKIDETIWCYEHRVVLEEKLGRRLTSKEIAHHINGNTLDNRPDNLEVMAWGDHTRHHHTFTTQWARAYTACVVCNETTRKHVSRGQCSRCYQRKR